mmetsp:Transcript_113197/g.315185  ORF Transcript_113197/g.315185 Transcript_113197/m.315185 type:complete len:329 (-) Transcript_113197:99-1085(-)
MPRSMALCFLALAGLATGQETEFCPTLHADMMRRQKMTWKEDAPFEEDDGKKHTPYITINGTTATVTVGDGSPYHPMVASTDPNQVHFVTHIYVMDQDGDIVNEQVLNPEGVDKAQVSFKIPAGVMALTAYEFCNLHGLWKGPTVDVPSTTQGAATCPMDPVPAGAFPFFVADFHRRQKLTWKEDSPYTEEDGKKHTPYITLSGSTGTVTVGDGNPYHPMNAGDNPAQVHWVTHIYVLDQSDAIVTIQNVDPEFVAKAQITFTVPSDATNLTAYEFCNLHGLWRGPTVEVVSPGGTADPGTQQASGAVAQGASSLAGAAAAVLTVLLA